MQVTHNHAIHNFPTGSSGRGGLQSPKWRRVSPHLNLLPECGDRVNFCGFEAEILENQASFDHA